MMHVPDVQVSQVPQVQADHGSQTFGSLGPAPVDQMKGAETEKVAEFGPSLPAESAPPMSVAAPVVEAPPVVVEATDEYVAPAPAVSCAAPAHVDEFFAPALDVTYTAPAPVLIDKIFGTPEIQEVVDLGPPLPDDSEPSMFATTTVVEEPPLSNPVSCCGGVTTNRSIL